jgi:hypothetical protein
MYETLSFVEIDGQHVELLPARTVLSMFVLDAAGTQGGAAGNGGPGGKGGTGGAGSGWALFDRPVFYTEGDVSNSLTGGLGGASSADGGDTTGGAASAGATPGATSMATPGATSTATPAMP